MVHVDSTILIQRLSADVTRTIPERHVADVVAWIRERHDEVRRLAIAEAEIASRLVDDLQQYVHDCFIDTCWPACPHHTHPLEFRHGHWTCPVSQEAVSALGELGATAS